MIVHSTRNNLDGTCTVRVEGAHPSTSDSRVCSFAAGAAGAHNKGYYAYGGLIQWCDDKGNPLPLDVDPAESTIALVTCKVTEP